jgi:hypothetical protein
MALAAAAVWPDHLERCLGVLGGLTLIAVSYRGILTGVAGMWTPAAALDGDESPSSPLRAPAATSSEPPSGGPPASLAAPSPGLVKFFTRHAILALGACVMMARFEFDPMAMLAGVTAPAVAAAVEIVRMMRARRSGLRPWSS